MTLHILTGTKTVSNETLLRLKPSSILIMDWWPGVGPNDNKPQFLKVVQVKKNPNNSGVTLTGHKFTLQNFCEPHVGYVDEHGHHPPRHRLSSDETIQNGEVICVSPRLVRGYADNLGELLCYVNANEYKVYWEKLFRDRLKQGVDEIFSEVKEVVFEKA